MTIGHQKILTADHPFLRHSRGPDAQPPCDEDMAVDRLLCDPIAEGDAVESLHETLAQWDQFCTMALHVDPPAASPPSEALDQLIIKFITSAVKTDGAIGTYWKERLYLCALPHTDMAEAIQLAEDFTTQLAALRPETVSIGIAPYPLLAYDKQHAWNNAIKALNHAGFLGPGSIVSLDAVSLNISGDRHYYMGDMDSAISEYSAALELDPNNTNVRNSIGVCFAELNDTAAAKSEFKLVTEIDPTEPMAWYNLGMLNRLKGRDETALAYFEKAYALKKDLYEIPFQIGRLLSEQCRWKEALGYAETASTLSQGHWSAHSLVGLCLAAMDRIPEAIQAYTKSIKRNPNNPWDISALGCLYDANNENPDICKTFLEQSIALAPENGLFHNRLGQWHEKHRQFEEAMAAYQQASAWGHDSTRQMESIQNARPNDEELAPRQAG